MLSKTSKTESGTALTPLASNDAFPFEILDTDEGPLSILAITKDMFGTIDESAELVGKLVQSVLSLRASKTKVTQELAIMGGQLRAIFTTIRDNKITKEGDSRQVRDKAAQLAWIFIEKSVGLRPSTARHYIRCHARFLDNADALRVFNMSELQLLVPSSVTDEHISILIAKKIEKPEMTRNDLKEILALVQKQEEQLTEIGERAEAAQSQFVDSELRLDVTERENRHLREEITQLTKAQTERQQTLSDLQSEITVRSNSFAAMQKQLADKQEECDRLTEQFKTQALAKPVIETKEIFVDKVPESLGNLSDALKTTLQEIEKAQALLEARKNEIVELEQQAASKRAELEAGHAAKRMLDEVLAAWEPFAAKYSTAQLAVQAGSNAELYMPTLKALSAVMSKFLMEVDSALLRQAA